MVELRGVTKRFGEFVAVERADLLVESGEFLTLLGPSGCGKTTLLRMIAGFETPTEGVVLLDGRDVTGDPPYRRDVNQVFQSYALFPHLNVAGNIAFGPRMKRVPRRERERRVREAISLVALDGLDHRMPSQLSGGQRQRVALARALVCQPRVLLLDEPLAALDAKLRRSMQLELKHLQTRLGITFVFVTHDQEEALVMSDRIAVMNRGRIEQVGRAADVYHRPATAFVADFLGQANLLSAAVQAVDARSLTVRADEHLILRLPPAALPPDGQVGYVCIRPEHVQVSRVPMATDNVFEAQVSERLFRGPMAELTLCHAGPRVVTALIASPPAGSPPFQPGERLHVHFPPEALILLPPGR